MKTETHKSIDTKDVFSFLQQLTVDCKDNGDTFQVTDRIEVIKDYLKDSAYNLLTEEAIFLLYGKRAPQKGEKVILISSHIDCVYQRCFVTEGLETYLGTFDNSFTNAALLHEMKNGNLPDNVLIAFTGDEEHDSAGAIAVNVYLTKQIGRAHV